MRALKTRKTLLSLAIIMALGACGGGGSGSGSTPDTTSAGTTTGRAVDGYLSGATVTCDANANNIADAGEMSTTTNAAGVFTFSSACSSTLLATGGIDIDTSYGFSGVLSAPAGSAFITPLTTLLAQSNLTAEQLSQLLGLPAGFDVTKLDPMENPGLHRVTLAVQQILQEIANFMGTQTNTPYDGSQYVAGAKALGDALAATPNKVLFTSSGNVDPSILSDVAQNVALQLGVTLTQPEIDALIAELADQVNTFLLAGDSVLVATAIELQNPHKAPHQHHHAKTNYLALENDAFKINGETFTLNDFKNGITIDNVGTLEFDYLEQGHVDFNKVAHFAMMVEEVGGKRLLQAKIENVNVARDANTGKLTISPLESTVVYAFARSQNGAEFNVTIKNVNFDPLVEGNHSVMLNYADIVNHVANHVQTPTGFDPDQFLNVYGQFNVKFVATNNINVRRANGDPLSTLTLGVNNTHYGVSGYGVEGKITINPAAY